MPRFVRCLPIAGILVLGACVTHPPLGPSVMAMPAQGKTFQDFQRDDAVCQQFAAQQVGSVTPGQAASDSAIGSTALGTALGAATGAALGAAAGNPGAGALIGGGAGLVMGGAAGSANARISGTTLQQRYDMRYIQCMAAQGESVPLPMPPPNAPPPGAYSTYPPYGDPYGPYYGGPPAGSVVVLGGYQGWGHFGYGNRRHW